MGIVRLRVLMTEPTGEGDIDTAAFAREVTLRMDRFSWDALEQESARLGTSEEELIRFAVLYYLADLDSGRVARDPPAAYKATD